jgi:O-antigen/teichoic acid export membrane protein
MVGGLGTAVLIQGFVLVTGVLAARLLGPTDRGHLALVWTFTLVVVQLGTLGLPLAITYEIAAGRATTRSLLRDLRRSATAQIAIATACHAVAMAVLVSATSTPATIAWMSLLVIPATLLQSFALAALQGTQNFRAYNGLRLVPVAVYAVLLGILAAADAASLATVAAAWVAGAVAAGVLTVIYTRKGGRRSAPDIPTPPRASPSAMRRFGLRGLLGWVSPTDTMRLDQLTVGLVLSAYDLGIYVAALAFTNLPRFLSQAVGNVAYPRVASAKGDAQRAQVWRFTIFGTGVSAVVAAVLAAAADPLVRLAFGDAFASAIGPLRILLVATVILCMRRVLADALRGAGMPGAGSRAEVASWLTLVPSVLVLGLTFGLNGVAVAVGLAYLSSLAVLLYSSRALSSRQRGDHPPTAAPPA